MDNLTIRGFLIVRADGSMRFTKRPTRLRLDEVAFPLNVSIPKMWGRVQAQRIDVDVPEPPATRVTIGEPELADEGQDGSDRE